MLKPRRPGLAGTVRAGLLGLMVAGSLLATGCHRSDATAGLTSSRPAKFHCPMHPTYTSDRPGDCPICNMKLVPVKSDAGDPAKAKFHCPMHPTYVSEKPGDCPICNMKLVPVPASAPPTTDLGRGAVAGHATLAVTPEKQHLIGMRTSKVERRALAQLLRTSGVLEHDETKLAKVAPRFGGWVRKLQVNYTGQEVEQGQPLFSVYSPELRATENDYLLAYQQLDRLQSAAAGENLDAQRLLAGARQRLVLWGVGDEEIRALEQRGQPTDELVLRAPVSGHVVSKTAVEGKAFMPGESLYEIGALHHLWVRAAIFESDLPHVRVGQKARVILPSLGNRAYESSITFVYPHIDPQTRRAEVRLELDNPKHELRPDMWTTVEIEVSLGTVLAVPASAVLDSGTRCVAFVLRADGHLEPREVKLGGRTEDACEVLSGLEEGEAVVTRALFLIDSESQLKAAIAGMETGETHAP